MTKYIIKNCPAIHYCSSEVCKNYHCGFCDCFGDENMELNCEDNTAKNCLYKQIAEKCKSEVAVTYGAGVRLASEILDLLQIEYVE